MPAVCLAWDGSEEAPDRALFAQNFAKWHHSLLEIGTKKQLTGQSLVTNT